MFKVRRALSVEHFLKEIGFEPHQSVFTHSHKKDNCGFVDTLLCLSGGPNVERANCALS
jgi:hypothetical protein